MSGNVRIGSTVMASPSGKSDRRVLHMQARAAVDLGAARAALGGLAVPAARRGPAAAFAWIQWMASRTTMPSSAGTRYSKKPPSSPGSPRNTHRVASVTIGPRPPSLRHERPELVRERHGLGPSRPTIVRPVAAARPRSHGPTRPTRAGWSSRLWAPRLSVAHERRRGRPPPDAVSMLRSSNTRSQAGLNERGPADPHVRPARLELVEPDERRLEVARASGRCRRATASTSWSSSWSRCGSSPSVRSNGASSAATDSASERVRQLGRAAVRRARGLRGGRCAGALPEHEQVRQRVAAEPVRAVQAARDLAGRVQARHASSRPSRRRPGRRPSCSASSGRPPSGPAVMSTSASSLNWSYIEGSLRRTRSAGR